jgi:hypothetical protein
LAVDSRWWNIRAVFSFGLAALDQRFRRALWRSWCRDSQIAAL